MSKDKLKARLGKEAAKISTEHGLKEPSHWNDMILAVSPIVHEGKNRTAVQDIRTTCTKYDPDDFVRPYIVGLVSWGKSLYTPLQLNTTHTHTIHAFPVDIWHQVCSRSPFSEEILHYVVI